MRMVTLPLLNIKAVRKGHSEVVNELKLNGADENIQNNGGESARSLPLQNELLTASTNGEGKTVTRLLQQGVSVLSKNKGGDSGLHIGAQHGHDDIVKIFLNNDTGINLRGDGNITPLMRAAEWGHLNTARLLIGRGADLELRDYHGRTALMWAARRDYADIVSELLTRGAQEDVTNNDNETALQTAENFGCFDVMKLFNAWHNSESRDEILFEASNEGKTRLVRGLINAGSSYEFRNAVKDQAIHKAARAGHTDVVRVLAEDGADINSPGQNGATPLRWSALTGQLATASFLLDLGAEINKQDDMGFTALHRATVGNQLSVVCELLDRQADKNIRNIYGDTPLAIARDAKYKDIALVLDDSKISSGEEYQEKVLLFATQNANVNLVAGLIKRGANFSDIKSPVGETLFQLATRFPQMKKQEYDQTHWKIFFIMQEKDPMQWPNYLFPKNCSVMIRTV